MHAPTETHTHTHVTALLRTVNDLLSAQGDNKLSLLSPFPICQPLSTPGLSESVLSCFHSYLSEDRTQTASVSGSRSLPPTALQLGVPQGSVLGPSVFIPYIQPLSAVQFNAIQITLIIPLLLSPKNERTLQNVALYLYKSFN